MIASPSSTAWHDYGTACVTCLPQWATHSTVATMAGGVSR